MAPQPFQHSSFPSSSGDTPNDSVWAGFTNNSISLFDGSIPAPQALPNDAMMQTSDSAAAQQLTTPAPDAATTPKASAHAADPEEGLSMAANTEQMDTMPTLPYETVNPQQMHLGHHEQQPVPSTYALGE